jgi:predicted aldo/keto reductase-like oxidoreductase
MMFPTQRLALEAVKKASKPVIAIKPLAGGRIPPNQAFEYVYENAAVDSCMVGAASEEELDTDLKAARKWGHSGLANG